MTSVSAPELIEIGDHLCLPVTSRTQQLRHTAVFAEGGLRADHKVLVVTDAPGPTGDWLLGRVPGAARALALGQIEIRSTAAVYRATGRLDPGGLLDAMAADIDEAVAQGYAGLRLTGCNSAPVPVTDPLLDYEGRVNALFADRPVAAMCQYHPAALGADVWRRLSQRHSCTATPEGSPGTWLRCRATADGVRLSGEVDLANRAALPGLLDGASGRPGRLTIDARQLRFADAGALGHLLRFAAGRAGPTVVMCGQHLAEVLCLLGAARLPKLRITTASDRRVPAR